MVWEDEIQAVVALLLFLKESATIQGNCNIIPFYDLRYATIAYSF